MSEANGTSHAVDELDTRVCLLVDNIDTTTSLTFPITSPATSKILYNSSAANVKLARTTVDFASQALVSWRTTHPAHRRDILLRAASILEARADECTATMMQETGATLPFSEFNIHTSASLLRDIASRCVSIMAGTVPICEDPKRQAIIIKEPVGVVLSIAPWNAPYILGFRAVLSPIAGGNTCILKGSELSPRCFYLIGDILREAGLPKGVCNVLYHRPEDAKDVTQALIQAPAIKKVNFTGSTGVGRVVAEMCGAALKPCVLELGGKAPAIVCEDADVELAATECVKGALLHSGQICMSTERVIVHKSVWDYFRLRARQEVKKMSLRDKGVLVLVSEKGVEKNRTLVRDALDKGAKTLIGQLGTEEQAGTRMRPIVIERVTRDMDIFYSESFGPTLSIMSFVTEDEALQLANDNEYGLNAAVFTQDLAKGLEMARKIEAGNVHINSMTVHDEPNLMHGGIKNSGWGRFNGDKGIEEYLITKTVTWME